MFDPSSGAALSLFNLLLLAGATPTPASTLEATADEPSETRVTARVDLAQLYTDDSQTDRHLLFTDLRGVLDVEGLGDFETHVDARGRLGLNEMTPSRYDISRLYVRYQKRSWFASAGRITMNAVAATQVDGGELGISPSEEFEASLFGGLMPHPITGAFNADFVNGGLGYTSRSKVINHAGGASAQIYQGKLDRLFLTERAYVRVNPSLSLFGRATIDLVSRSGIIGDLRGKAETEQSAVERVDLTNFILMARYRPTKVVDFTLSGSHVHAVLPNKWWQDWVEQERARLGFTIDGPLPVGTRRSNVRLVSNLHFGKLSPYASVRYDRRHEDNNNGYEGRVGLKFNDFDFGYVDASIAHRRHFEASYQHGLAQGGFDIVTGLNFDAGFGVLRVNPVEAGETQLLYDVNALLFLDLGQFSETLRGVSAMTMYQTFIDPEMTYHVFYLRFGYRFRS